VPGISSPGWRLLYSKIWLYCIQLVFRSLWLRVRDKVHMYVITYNTLYRSNASAADCVRCLLTYTMSVLFHYTDTASNTGV